MEKIRSRIKRHEGLRLDPYRCSQGFLTIGYGHRITQYSEYAKGIVESVADDIFERDFFKAQRAASMLLPTFKELPTSIQEVLVEMCFQLGFHGVLKFKKMLASLAMYDYDSAATEMLDSLWHKQTPSRAEELAGIVRSCSTKEVSNVV